MNVLLEHNDTASIKRIAVQCPYCNNWFKGREIVRGDCRFRLRHKRRIVYETFVCPVCVKEFSGYQDDKRAININIKEVSGEEVYDGCLDRKEVLKQLWNLDDRKIRRLKAGKVG